MHFSVLSSRWHWLLLLALPLAAFGSYYGKGISTHGDNLLHLYRLVALHKNLAAGNFYPRWTAELFLGFGYPLLNFYASSTYYLAEALHLLGAGYENAFIYTLLILLVCAAVGIYRLAYDIFADMGVPAQAPALVATAAYLFAPYLLFNLYVRGAIAEVGAQALLPWVLWSFRRLLSSPEPVRYWLFSIFTLAVLAFTHTVSLLLVPPILLVYALVLLWRYRAQPQVWRRLWWFAAATASAAAVSATFWLPALLEKQYLTTQAQEAAAQFLDQHTWNWQTFLDADWTVAYNDPAGTSLRRMQLLLAIMGMVLCRRWNAEWLFMAALALVSCLLVGEGTIPLWRSHPLILTIQFPWRLLGVATLPFAVLTGGLLTRGAPRQRPGCQRPGWNLQTLGLLTVIGIIIYANYPRLGWLNRLEVEPEQVNLTSISQYEAITGRYGLSAATFREFMPRWVNTLEFQHVPPITPDPLVAIALEDASSQRWAMSVVATQPSRLLFSTFFFPGWQVILENEQTLESYPVSDFGVLGVDLPSGEYELQVSWEATPARIWGQAISGAALLLLGVYCLSRPLLRLAAIYPLCPLVVVAGLSLAAPFAAPPYHQAQDQPAEAGVHLLGYTTYQEEASALYIFPHWHITEAPTDLVMHWHLLDQSGNSIASHASFPYFNTLRAFQWSTNMVVDDAYYFPLPPGLTAGIYTLALAVKPADAETSAVARAVGEVEIARDVAPLPTLDHPLQVQFQEPSGGNQITLRGYHVAPAATASTGSPAAAPLPQSAVADLTVAPGDTVIYTLNWQAAQNTGAGTQVFVQLLDHTQATLTQVNQPLVLSQGAPYYLWNPYWLRENSYALQIHEDASGGLYRPYVGLYHLDTGVRFGARTPDGGEAMDGLFLPPLKVARRTAAPLANSAAVHFGDAIRLEGYTLELPSGGLAPHATMTLTVQYQSLAPVNEEYTQFVHLRNPTLGMAAQFDAPPQGGGNPTSSWVPGEVIVDMIPLQIAPDAQPGQYTLSLGLYDPGSGGVRLPVLDEANQRQPDDQFVVEEVRIQ